MRQPAQSSLLLSAVRSLRFSDAQTDCLTSLSPAEWQQLLKITDESRITLPLATRCGSLVPEPVRTHLNDCLARNAVRHIRVVEAHSEVFETMRMHGAEFLVLKGLAHGPGWNGEVSTRPQHDIDLYCPPESIPAARQAAKSLGYEPFGAEANDADHLPVMIRQTGWRWRDDYYDPEQPLALELHHRFWNPTLGFAVRRVDGFWSRRIIMPVGGLAVPALHPVDALDYAAWHALRHLLRGSLRIHHIYEIAHRLHHTADDLGFWSEWRDTASPSERIPETIIFRLAREWFGCNVNPIPERHVEQLPHNIQRWFSLFAYSPMASGSCPNKDELILNLCLARNHRDRRLILTRRLFPAKLPVRIPDAHVPERTPNLRSRSIVQTTGFIVRRVPHHLGLLAPLVRSGFRWWLSGRTHKTPAGT